ncbi:hypothetical protein TI05_10555, partial [Achromatium sp. WMS3]
IQLNNKQPSKSAKKLTPAPTEMPKISQESKIDQISKVSNKPETTSQNSPEPKTPTKKITNGYTTPPPNLKITLQDNS